MSDWETSDVDSLYSLDQRRKRHVVGRFLSRAANAVQSGRSRRAEGDNGLSEGEKLTKAKSAQAINQPEPSRPRRGLNIESLCQSRTKPDGTASPGERNLSLPSSVSDSLEVSQFAIKL